MAASGIVHDRVHDRGHDRRGELFRADCQDGAFALEVDSIRS
jgi:hypothetical protein